MPVSRYGKDNVILRGTTLATPAAVNKIRAAVSNSTLRYQTITLQGLGRLDELAGQYYSNGRYWWIIAAASDIGWGLQVPAGTRILIPDLGQVIGLLE